MRRNQQIRSRRQASNRFRQQQLHRKLKRQWHSSVVQVLRRQGRNNRLNRVIRRHQVLGW
jgi:hypothetical protein